MLCHVTRNMRALLVDAAAGLLDNGGPQAVTLREVGRLAGVSHNASYKHFADKEELLAAVASRELARQSKAIIDADATKNTVEVLRSLTQGYIRWARAYPARFRLTFGGWKRESSELIAEASRARSALIAIIERGQIKHELPAGNSERLMSLLLAQAHGAADLALNGHLSAQGKGAAEPEDLVDDLLALLARAAEQRKRRR
jgi:AcrR family transcriptional regulator